jgi:hypothetical protein
MSRALPFAILAALSIALPSSARAADPTAFMSKFSGEWLGTGQLLIGAENGLQFHCELNGDPSRTRLTFGMTGRCWMGKLSAPVHAQLRFYAEGDRFYGEFMDGADGDGVDVVGERVGDGFAMQLSRGMVQGRLTADAVNADQLKVMLYYHSRAHNQDIPVVAMGFTRKGAGGVLPDYLPETLTGSLPQVE